MDRGITAERSVKQPIASVPQPEREPRLVLDSEIDLAGNSCAQRLTADERELVVGNCRQEHRRQWPLDEIRAFRIEPSIGSHFLQAEIGGRWVDVFRFPGRAEAETAEWLGWLNGRCRRSSLPDDQTVAGQSGLAGGRLPRRRGETNPTPPWRTTSRLLWILRPFYGSMLLLLALSLGAVAIDVAPPMLQRLLVDRVLKVPSDPRSSPQLLRLLLAIVAGLLLFRASATLVAIWKGYVSSRVGTAMTANLRDELVKKLNSLPLAFYDRRQVGILMSHVAYDTETLHTLVYHLTSGFLLQSLQLAGIGVMLAYLNAKLAFITLLPMPLIIAGSWYFTRYLQPRHNHYWEAVGRQASALLGMLSGMRVVKAFVQEERESRRFQASSRRLRDSRLTVDISTSTFTASMGFLFALGGLVVWYAGGRDVLSGDMTLGSLMAFLAYLAMFYAPLTSIAEATTWFASFFATSQRIGEVLDAAGESQDPEPPLPLGRVQGRIEFQAVSFGYDKSRPVLEDLSFAIAAGEMIGIVGRSGSGKSTLVSLIGRMYEVDSGQILVDGVDVREIHPRQLRRQIGMVPQEPFLFRGTVAANVTYGNLQATPEQIFAATRQADCHEFIMRMPFAYETQLGEGGSGLSGGERQRLSIARAVLCDPVILILDEATASVDAESERAICNAIRRWARRRTTIVVAHRLSTLQAADRLLVFDQGRLAEEGTPAELRARGGLYSALASMQYGPSDGGRSENDRSLPRPLFGSDRAPQLGRDTPPGDGPARDDCGLCWLDRDDAQIADDGQGLLRVTVRGQPAAAVQAAWALPAREPRRYISLRRREPSGRESELGMIRALDDWPQDAQQAVSRSLARRYLLQRIRSIRRVQPRGNQLELSVVTDRGPAKVQLERPGDGYQCFGNDGLLLADARGNYYVIPARSELPTSQQRLLALYLGD
jgi:ATP-binding cassette subfamily B protein